MGELFDWLADWLSNLYFLAIFLLIIVGIVAWGLKSLLPRDSALYRVVQGVYGVGCGGGCLLIIVGIFGVMIWSIVSGISLGEDRAKPVEESPDRTYPKQMTMYVMGSVGGPYWVRWYDGGKTTIDVKETGVTEEEAVEHHLDLGSVPTEDPRYPKLNYPNPLTIEAGKSEDWEGNLELVVQVDDKYFECKADTSTSASNLRPSISISYVIGKEPPAAARMCGSWFYL